MPLELVPCTLREANAFIEAHHRHHGPVRGCRAVLAAALDGQVVGGGAVVGRPVARLAQDGWTAEITRLATDGSRNAASFLLGASWRAARALGYKRLITYTLPERESGASLRGAGWDCVGMAGGGSWSRESRPRVDVHPLQQKLRWERAVSGAALEAARPSLQRA